MPQMSPMFWLILMLVFLFFYLSFMVIIYFSYSGLLASSGAEPSCSINLKF